MIGYGFCSVYGFNEIWEGEMKVAVLIFFLAFMCWWSKRYVESLPKSAGPVLETYAHK